MKKKEPGLIDVPGPNDLRPHAKNVKGAESAFRSPERDKLKFAQPIQMVGDFGAPDGNWYGSLSPASGTRTVPLPGKPKIEEKDPKAGTTHPTIEK